MTEAWIIWNKWLNLPLVFMAGTIEFQSNVYCMSIMENVSYYPMLVYDHSSREIIYFCFLVKPCCLLRVCHWNSCTKLYVLQSWGYNVHHTPFHTISVFAWLWKISKNIRFCLFSNICLPQWSWHVRPICICSKYNLLNLHSKAHFLL